MWKKCAIGDFSFLCHWLNSPIMAAHIHGYRDGTVAEREEQARPLATMRGKLARVYVTGNHEYFSGAQGWVEHMAELGWEAQTHALELAGLMVDADRKDVARLLRGAGD
jgi:hypothetical protein